MRYLIAVFIVFLSCNSAGDKKGETADASQKTANTPIDTNTKKVEDTTAVSDTTADNRAVYSNARFKEVRVQRLGGYRFEITGRGQIFEANFNWYVTDGVEEIKSGYTTTDAGAPEWGEFSFTVRVKKKRPELPLHVVLYEASAKDGSRQHELPVLLY